MRKVSDLYQRIIVWSDEDNCFIGTCPEIMYGGIHGDDALKVLKELNVAIEEAVEIFQADGQPLPIPKGAAIF